MKICQSDTLYFMINAGDAVYLGKHRRVPVSNLEHQQYAEPVARYRETPNCHDFNQINSSTTSLRIVVGFTSGDLLIQDLLNHSDIPPKRFNIDNCICDGFVTSVSWIPNSENLFIAGFSTGDLFVFDTNKQDQTIPPLNPQLMNNFAIYKPADDRLNPFSRWRISKASVNDLSFSPDGKYLATASSDGYLRVFDFFTERFIVAFRSFYGGLLCVSWSPDGRYLLTGGEDDFVTVWSFRDLKAVVRGKGHHSWVSRVQFDTWKCTENNYRFASTGQDTRLLLWDFVEAELRKPRSSSRAFMMEESANQNQSATTFMVETIWAEVPIIEPCVAHRAHHEPISDIVFLEDGIVSSCWAGISKFWARPGYYSSVQRQLFPDDQEKESNMINPPTERTTPTLSRKNE